jgi:hypothetical protein
VKKGKREERKGKETRLAFNAPWMRQPPRSLLTKSWAAFMLWMAVGTYERKNWGRMKNKLLTLGILDHTDKIHIRLLESTNEIITRIAANISLLHMLH